MQLFQFFLVGSKIRPCPELLPFFKIDYFIPVQCIYAIMGWVIRFIDNLGGLCSVGWMGA